MGEGRREGDAPRAQPVRRRGHAAQRHLRARAPRHVRDRTAPKGFKPLHRRARRGRRTCSWLPPTEGSASSRRTSTTGRTVSFYGDNHPVYAGSVVRAMASAKDGAPHVAALFAEELRAQDAKAQPARDAAWAAFAKKVDGEWRATVVRVDRLTPTIVEVIVHAPAAARQLRAWSVFPPARLRGLRGRGARLAHGHGGPRAHGRVGRQGQGPAVAHRARDGRQLAAVRDAPARRARRRHGPDGHAHGDRRRASPSCCAAAASATPCCSRSRRRCASAATRCSTSRRYRRAEDIYKVEEIEAATDQVIWSVDAGTPPVARRPQDRAFVGNIVQAMLAFAKGELGEIAVPLPSCSRIIAIGSDRMMAAVKDARHGVLERSTSCRGTSPSRRSTRPCSA